MFFKKNQAQKWTKKILKEKVENLTPIPCDDYLHEADQQSLAALKKIPLLDKLCSKFIAAFNEPLSNIEDMSNKIRITEKQLPRIYNMVKNISKKLGIEMPKLYLELNRDPNAYTYGTETATITVTSGLLECMEDDEVYAVLAHECGHIACKHVLYHTMGSFILSGGILGIRLLDSNGFFANALTLPLKLAFYRWMRYSELSADRAAAICCKQSKPVVETMMRLAGGTTHIDTEINQKLFIEQATDYKNLLEDSKLNKALDFLIVHNHTHPLLSVRAYETSQWENSQQFKDILIKMHTKL